MNPYKPAFFVVLAAFIVSIVVGVWRGRDDGSSGDGPGFRPRQSGPAADCSAVADRGEPAPGAPGTTGDAALRAVQAKLEACEQARWSAVGDVMQRDAAQRGPARDGGAVTADASDFARQQQALCEVARDAMSGFVKLNKDLLFPVIEPVGTAPWVDEWMDQKLKIETEMFDLSGPDRAALESGYRTLWANNGARLQGLIQQPDVDFAALIAAIRSLWQQEDALLGRVLGPDALSRYRATELKPRTLLMAMLAIWAGLPFDQNIAW